MKHIHTEGPGPILKSRFARGIFPLVAALLAFALAAPSAYAAAVTPPDKPVLIDTLSSAGSVLASSSSATSYPATKAFDGAWSTINSDRWLAYINPNKHDYTGGATGETPAYVVYRFNAATKVNMLRIRIPGDSDYAPTDRAPKAWTFRGSNDGETWTTLDTRSGVTWASGTTVKTFSFENGTKYAYYKFECTEIGGVNDFLQIYELQFLYDAGIVLTDLTSPSGTVTTTTAGDWVKPAKNAFDNGTAHNNDDRSIHSGTTVDWIYTFDTPTKVNAYKVYCPSTTPYNYDKRMPKTWTFEAKNAEDATWIVLDTQSSETGWTALESRYYAFENNTAYDSYRFAVTAVQDGSDAYVQIDELEFFYVNTDAPKLGNTSLVRTGAAVYALTATEDANAADLAWIADDGAAATTNGWATVAEGATNTWTVSGLTADKTYEISVVATNAAGSDASSAGVIYTGALAFGAATDANETGLVAGGVTVSRATADPFPLTVNYTISGSAGSAGTTWETPVAVTIPANAASAVIPVVPLLDWNVDEDVTITVTLLAGDYELPSPAIATLALRNRAAVKKTDFAKSMALTPSATALAKIGETAWADFPVLVRLPAEASALLQSADGTDLFFTDENDASLPFEVETFDPAGTTFVWVKVPSLSSATELTVWFGGASNQDNDPTAVWSRYVGVWHFDADAAGTTTVADATGHGLNGTTAGTLTAEVGPFGDSCLKGTANTSAPDFEPGFSVGSSFSASGWFKLPAKTTASGNYVTFAKKKTGNWDAKNGWYLEMDQSSQTKLKVILDGNTPSADIKNVSQNWQWFQIVSDGSTVKVYVDGSQKISSSYTVVANSASYLMGAPNGCFDEYRLRKGAASAAETALEYATMADAAFFDLGAIENVDDTAQVFATPTASQDGSGNWTIAVELLENNGVVGAIYDDGSAAWTNVIQQSATPGTYYDTPTLGANTTYVFAAYGRNAKGTEVVQKGGVFYNGELSVVKVSDAVENGLVPGVFRISRADTAHDLMVAYTIGGTAAAGQTYAALSGTATIPAGSTSVDVEVVPLLDAATTEDKTVALALASGLYGIDAQAGSAEMTVVNLAVPTGFNTWVATADGLASVDSNWSAGHAPLATEQVLFDGRFSTADCEWDAAATPTVASWTQTNGYTGTVTVDTVFPEKGGFTCLTVSGEMNIASGSITHMAHTSTYKVDQYRLRIDVGGNLTVASGAKITARAKGSYGQRSEGQAAYGGSYNGVSSWGSLIEPYGIGSSANDYGTYTCWAGGAIWIEVAGTTTLDGAINANGIAAKGSSDTHAGSGGAVFLKSGSLSGSGKISADCENTDRSSNTKSAAGGRVSILLTNGELSSFPYANITAVAGNTSYGNVGGVGTVLVRTPQKPNGVLYLRDRSGKYSQYGYRPKPNQLTRIPAGQAWVIDGIVFGENAILEVPTGTTLDLRGGLASVSSTGNTLDESGLIVDGGTLLLPAAETHTISGKWIFEPQDFALVGNLVVTNGAGVGTLLLYSTTSNEVRTCGLSVSGNMHVASGAYLRAVRGGYIATGASTVGGDLKGCHGGTRAATTTASRSYDSFFHPRHPGAFGSDNGRVNVGGGAIRLAVGGTLTLDGVAIATPSVAEDRCGAAGSIDITAAQLEGGGRIEANGNSRSYTAADASSAGGGGRIAVRLTGNGNKFSDEWLAKINAKGYYSSKITAQFSSSAGSVYLQDGTQAEGAGKIIIRNTGDTANNVAVTELPSLKAGGENDDFRRASLSLEAAARVQLHDNVRMAAFDAASGTVLDLNGKTLTVKSAKLGGTKLSIGTYAAGDEAVAGYVTDSVGGGELIVTGGGFYLYVR